MNVVIGIQARSNSSRLPGKVLLPINNIPVVVLAAERAKNNHNFETVVLTSSEKSDDALSRMLESYGVQYYRGSLCNVLSRFVEAFSCYSEDTVVVRLTADNVFPDSELINEVIEDLKKNKYEYIIANGIECGLPYGVSVEVTYLKHLREANKLATSLHDLEHVTPYIRREYGVNLFLKYLDENLGDLVCTIDTLDEFFLVSEVFSKYQNAIEVSTWSLIQSLEQNSRKKVNATKLSLGCVQMGLDYGITNKNGKMSEETAHKILDLALSGGVKFIDTARAYGDSEKVIGGWLGKNNFENSSKVITKLGTLTNLKESSTLDEIEKEVRDSIYISCNNLKIDSIDILMLHRAEHLIQFDGFILTMLKKLSLSGTIKELGVSVQTPEELDLALQYEQITHIQLPFNILDSKWKKSEKAIFDIKKKRKLIIHVRSVFLQGLILSKSPSDWKKASINKPELMFSWLNKCQSFTNSRNVQELCIRYIKSHLWIDSVVMGVNTVDELQLNMNAFLLDDINPEQINYINDTNTFYNNEVLLNPSNWS
ncbi:aldo/keto reductase [Pseudoalteromonas fuliginea]|uniref:aldo/keto reductase n=1 Tax=Pseudoalteromonas fuliginea TaxID=1872678 RepID=UPI00317F20F0